MKLEKNKLKEKNYKMTSFRKKKKVHGDILKRPRST
jgi:hypothetical protein